MARDKVHGIPLGTVTCLDVELRVPSTLKPLVGGLLFRFSLRYSFLVTHQLVVMP